MSYSELHSATNTLNMHEAPGCLRYRYVRTRIRFRVGSSGPARSHFSRRYSSAPLEFPLAPSSRPHSLSLSLSLSLSSLSSFLRSFVPHPSLSSLCPFSRVPSVLSRRESLDLDIVSPRVRTSHEIAERSIDQLPGKLRYESQLDEVNDADGVGRSGMIASHRRNFERISD